tara:strand:- start:1089 stop:1457 length:369 start_codon:yes stop_codon:yes gene_type:complete
LNDIFIYIAQLVISLGILNSWLLRFNKKSIYRGSTANSLLEEFKIYGYPIWFFYTVGTLKIIFSVMIFAGFWNEILLTVGSVGMMILMIGAIFSHIKIRDPLVKFIPAIVIFGLTIFILVFT